MNGIAYNPNQILPPESHLFENPEYTNTNLAVGAGGVGVPPQSPLITRWYKNLHWRHKIQLGLPLLSALIKGLRDYSDAIRRHGIYNAGQPGLAGFVDGLLYGVLADFTIEALYHGIPRLIDYGRTRNWW